MSNEKSKPIIKAASISDFDFQGPLPAPTVLDEYEKIIPGSAERIIRMCEQEQLSRHQIEIEALSQETKANQISQVIAFLAILVSLLVGFCISNYYIFSGVILAVLGPISAHIALQLYFLHYSKNKNSDVKNERTYK